MAMTQYFPQIMATFQTMVSIPELSEVTLQSWHKFLTTLGPAEIGPHVGPTSAAFVSAWNKFSPKAKQYATYSMEYISREVGRDLGQHLDDIVDISPVTELNDIHHHLQALRSDWTSKERLQRLLDRSTSDNVSVGIQSLSELKAFLLKESRSAVKELVSGDMFDPIVGQAVGTLLAAACRDGDGIEQLKILAYECIGILGAVDPDRCELPPGRPRIIVKSNFTDEDESMQFALHLICDLLVGAFRSTSDIKHQSFLAFTIQELLKFCQFKPALVGAGTGISISNKVRNRWRSLPKHILETVTPLLEGKFALNIGPSPEFKHPIYSHQSTYREWIQLWTAHLINKASGPTAQTIFGVFGSAVRNKDAGVAHHLLPHLVLNILIGGNEEDAQQIRSELLVVLEDQVHNESNSSPDKKLLSAQVRKIHPARSRF
jgi:serine/threonine-protein kinase ATR